MIRIGHAWDTHKLVENRKLILGGLEIESKVGLLGHSDADVVLHAVAESLLGSLALGDLGTFYPDNSDKTLNMDSKIILKECYQKVKDLGFKLINLDLTIYAEFVKINPIRLKIQESISNLLGIDKSFVSIKATTWEKMGFIGKGEAIACECVCLVSND
ncbi:MAG: 2-C-methyl-D-erythritol 2,4-cyclodiphosphate synthase [Acholeplasmatales bacterium]|nr:2-C-methyl-D-erythritol 2,4-cyclodiphosphate synthase [Acholeplasmatales bacterium]